MFFKGKISSPRKITCGVPQGSILGPLLFLLYINDLPCSLHFSTPRMYADDTNITTSGSSLNNIIYSVDRDLISIRDWLLANKLSLNVSKTEQLFIAPDSNISKIACAPQIFMDGKPIGRVRSAKSVGVYIDERLSWDDHVNYLSKRISSVIAGLRQVRPFISTTTAVTIYRSLILPLFDYCDVAWDTLSKTSAQRLQKLQNRAARVITCQGYEVRSYDIRSHLSWNTLVERRDKHKAVAMFKVLNNKAPAYLSDLFKPIGENFSYGLRGRNRNLSLPLPRTEYGKKSFNYCGAKLWNGLPNDLKDNQTVRSFKRALSSSYH